MSVGGEPEHAESDEVREDDPVDAGSSLAQVSPDLRVVAFEGGASVGALDLEDVEVGDGVCGGEVRTALWSGDFGGEGLADVEAEDLLDERREDGGSDGGALVAPTVGVLLQIGGPRDRCAGCRVHLDRVGEGTPGLHRVQGAQRDRSRHRQCLRAGSPIWGQPSFYRRSGQVGARRPRALRIRSVSSFDDACSASVRSGC